MGTVFRFLANYEGLIYILLALGALFTVRQIIRSWYEVREAVFGLEREYAVRRLSQAIALTVFIGALFMLELIVASFLAPALPSAGNLATPTLDMIQNSGEPSLSEPSPAGTGFPPSNPLPETLGNGCIPGQLTFTSPNPGQEVSGTVTLEGTANIENFGFYKYEVAPQGSDAWATISAGRGIVINGELGLWDTSVLNPGDYALRLVATDNQGESTTPCMIPVRILAP
jgi:hypothetical protein